MRNEHTKAAIKIGVRKAFLVSPDLQSGTTKYGDLQSPFIPYLKVKLFNRGLQIR